MTEHKCQVAWRRGNMGRGRLYTVVAPDGSKMLARDVMRCEAMQVARAYARQSDHYGDKALLAAYADAMATEDQLLAFARGAGRQSGDNGMTKNEKNLLKEHALALNVACNVLYRNWLDVSRIQRQLDKLLAASNTEEEKPAESVVPVEPFLPGEYLADEIKERCGKRRVTRVTAHALAEMLDQNDAEIWLKLQEKYDEACAQDKGSIP